VLLFSDGKDETADAAVRLAALDGLKRDASAAKIAIHTVGCAETASAAVYFAGMKDISTATEGLFVAMDVNTKTIPQGTRELLTGLMHEQVSVHLDLSGLSEAVPVNLAIKTAAGKVAKLVVPKEEVAKALVVQSATPPDPTPPVTPPVVDPPPSGDPDAGDPAGGDEPATGPTPPVEPGAATPPPAPPAEAPSKMNYLWIGLAVLVLLILILAVVSSRRRAAAEQARALAEAEVEAARFAESEARATTLAAEVPASQPVAWLEMCDDSKTRHAITLLTFKIGRGQHNDLVLRNDSVSGNHCVLSRNREGIWTITDLNSGNGVVLNGKRVGQGPVAHGDIIELGDLKMRFITQA
jgi:hypothetical protein